MNDDSLIRLLVVEDDEDDYFLLNTTLKETSFQKQLTWASSYGKALQALKSASFDLAIIDYRLGIHTGIELVTYIQEHFPYIPTILLTGFKESAIDHEALKSGVYDYLVKDQYTAESLDRSIRYAIEKANVLKSLKESENKFKNLFENAVEYVFLIDAGYIVIDANKAALKILGMEKKENIKGLNISKYISRDLTGTERPNSSVEIEFSVPELNKKCFCIMNMAIVDGEKGIYQLVLHDITERRMNEQREKMFEKQILTGKVARIIAHEIKNPLTNINLSLAELGVLIKEKSKESDEFLSIIDRNSKRINNLIEDLLNATRFDTLIFQKLDVHELVSETLTHIQDRIKLKNIQVEKNVQPNLMIKGDREKLVIALLNVLVNAVEAVTDKEEGKLEVAVTSTSADTVSILISDNGKGIPESDLGKLFEPFFTSKKGGTGLGLTATYNIITKHDGSVKVASKIGAGTTFTITLPQKN